MAEADAVILHRCAARIGTDVDHEELETILALFAMIKLRVKIVLKRSDLTGFYQNSSGLSGYV